MAVGLKSFSLEYRNFVSINVDDYRENAYLKPKKSIFVNKNTNNNIDIDNSSEKNTDNNHEENTDDDNSSEENTDDVDNSSKKNTNDVDNSSEENMKITKLNNGITIKCDKNIKCDNSIFNFLTKKK